jgi:hypothetical protein
MNGGPRLARLWAKTEMVLIKRGQFYYVILLVLQPGWIKHHRSKHYDFSRYLTLSNFNQAPVVKRRIELVEATTFKKIFIFLKLIGLDTAAKAVQLC